MPTKVKTEATCDRCGHTELVDGYLDRNPRWTLLVVKTYQKWLFPKSPSTHEGEYVTQHQMLCPACSAAFVNLMQPGRLAELTTGLTELVTLLHAHKQESARHRTRVGAASAEALAFAIERLNKLISG